MLPNPAVLRQFVVTGGVADGLQAGAKLVAITTPVWPEVGIVSVFWVVAPESVHPARPAVRPGIVASRSTLALRNVFPGAPTS